MITYSQNLPQGERLVHQACLSAAAATHRGRWATHWRETVHAVPLERPAGSKTKGPSTPPRLLLAELQSNFQLPLLQTCLPWCPPDVEAITAALVGEQAFGAKKSFTTPAAGQQHNCVIAS
jgi:hypothetical protein